AQCTARVSVRPGVSVRGRLLWHSLMTVPRQPTAGLPGALPCRMVAGRPSVRPGGTVGRPCHNASELLQRAREAAWTWETPAATGYNAGGTAGVATGSARPAPFGVYSPAEPGGQIPLGVQLVRNDQEDLTALRPSGRKRPGELAFIWLYIRS